FLPARRSPRRSRLDELRRIGSTLVIFEAPHRIAETLRDAQEVLGDRRAVLGRELTKVHEEFIRGRLSEVREGLAEVVRGELTLIIDAPEDGENHSLDDGDVDDAVSGPLTAHVRRLVEEGLSRPEALKRAARSRGLSRRAAYNRMLEE